MGRGEVVEVKEEREKEKVKVRGWGKCGELLVDVVGEVNLGREMVWLLKLLRSFGPAKVSFNGARKPSVFQTPEPLLLSVT